MSILPGGRYGRIPCAGPPSFRLMRRPGLLALAFLRLVIVAVICRTVGCTIQSVTESADVFRPHEASIFWEQIILGAIFSAGCSMGDVSLVGVADAVIVMLTLGVTAGLVAGYIGGWG